MLQSLAKESDMTELLKKKKGRKETLLLKQLIKIF